MSGTFTADNPTSAAAAPAGGMTPSDWLLGPHGRSRLAIKRMVVAAAVYVMYDLWRYAAALFGHADPVEVRLLAFYDAACVIGFYAAVRAGLTRRLRDPAMTATQCLLGFVSVAVSYVLVPDLRGVQLSMVTAGLLFTAFMSNPAHCRALGWGALLAVSAAMMWAQTFRPTSFRTDVEVLNFVFSLVAMPLVAVLASELSRVRNDLKLQRRELRAAMARIELLARSDDLTGLPNRRRAIELLRDACDAADRTGAPLSFGYLDIDHFKRVNDTLGHAAGDQVLRLVAESLQAELRAGDQLARWGGEEFLLILPATGAGDARQVIDRLRQQLGASTVWATRPELRVTFSAGAATRVRAEPAEHTLELADQALYKAKAAGRNCTVLADRIGSRVTADR